MKLSSVLLTGFMTCNFILLTGGIVGYFGIVKIDNHIDEIADNRLPSIYNLVSKFRVS